MDELRLARRLRRRYVGEQRLHLLLRHRVVVAALLRRERAGDAELEHCDDLRPRDLRRLQPWIG